VYIRGRSLNHCLFFKQKRGINCFESFFCIGLHSKHADYAERDNHG
jgi:hypothetical protein